MTQPDIQNRSLQCLSESQGWIWSIGLQANGQDRTKFTDTTPREPERPSCPDPKTAVFVPKFQPPSLLPISDPGERMNWIGRKIHLYNVTIGLYMLDWWERYLFNTLMLCLLWYILQYLLGFFQSHLKNTILQGGNYLLRGSASS